METQRGSAGTSPGATGKAGDRDAGPAASAGRLWGGGFEAPLDPRLEAFCSSLAFDVRLLRHDVLANRAWVEALREAGVLDPGAAARLDAALETILAGGGAFIDARDAGGAADGPAPGGTGPSPAAPGGTEPASAPSPAPEDVHTLVERLVEARVGADLAGRLRTGRSRNDLVATDLRLFCRDALAALRRATVDAAAGLTDLAGRCGEIAVPGYTHLRRAQPILLAHQILAHVERLRRDERRFAAARTALEDCPLGSAALAGTTVPVDREALARRLGFARPSANSLDAVSDRDFVVEILSACALAMVHLSQIAEDLILATGDEMGWLRLGDAAATGSSLMPQKKNPDPLELMRGKAGRIIGRLAGFLATLKGLPSAYNRDLQEDKEPLFDAVDTTAAALGALAALAPHLEPVPERGLAGEAAGGILATDLADHLVARGLPFSRAHDLAGRAAARARDLGLPLDRLPPEDRSALSPELAAAPWDWADLGAALRRRACEGGTAPARVAEALARARAWVAARRAPGDAT